MWVPFNEGWGQFDAEEAVRRIRELDRTRTVDHASGWHDQYIGDIKSNHVYFRKYRFRKDKLGRAVVLSEFGGYKYREEGHCFGKKEFGYKSYNTRKELLAALRSLYEKEILPAKREGLSAAVYTQLSDVEDELNGLISCNRKVTKTPHRRCKGNKRKACRRQLNTERSGDSSAVCATVRRHENYPLFLPCLFFARSSCCRFRGFCYLPHMYPCRCTL